MWEFHPPESGRAARTLSLMSAATQPSPTLDAAFLSRHDRPGPRYTSYPTAVQFHDGFDASSYEAELQRAAHVAAPLSLYVHLPFCAERCLYCACNVVISRRPEIAEPYLERLLTEIDRVADRLGDRRRVAQLHLGGGTPTYYRPDQLARLMERLATRFDLEPEAEVAVEVDPRVTTHAHLDVLAGHGFNRMSLGVQDFDPKVQEAVRRVQSVAETEALMRHGRAHGFGSINVDLIYGLPHQTPASFRRTLDRVVELQPDRLAVYSFALVPWLKHHQKLLPQADLPEGLAKFELLAVARERLGAAGYRDIGMDHFALPDDELSRAQEEGRLWRNFMGYTTKRGLDTIGFGVSAIGALGGSYVQNHKKLNRYYEAIDAGRLPVERGLALTPDDEVRRDVIQSWMCQFLVDKADVAHRHGIDFDAYFSAETAALRTLEREGFLTMNDEMLIGTRLGRAFPRNVAMVFDAYLPKDGATEPRFSRTV